MAEVADLFADPNTLKEYQEGFVKKELVSGIMGQPGAISKIWFKNGKQEMELTETIISNDLPNSYEAFYHHVHMDNTHTTTFTSLSDSVTRYRTEGEYTRVSFVPKIMMKLFPSMFSKPAQKWMANFKQLAESK